MILPVKLYSKVKRDSIRSHLRPYSIHGRRSTTINHAFASAIAPNDDYDDERLRQAIRDLGQDPDQDLMCAYCEVNSAETWDHVHGLVTGKRYSGHGHLIGNLLPCCRNCNSSKGNKDWRVFLRTQISDDARFAHKLAQLERFFDIHQGQPLGQDDIERICPEEMGELKVIRDQILQLMRDADVVADRVRTQLRTRSE